MMVPPRLLMDGIGLLAQFNLVWSYWFLVQVLTGGVMGCVQVVFSEADGVSREAGHGVAYLHKFVFVLCNAYSIRINTE